MRTATQAEDTQFFDAFAELLEKFPAQKGRFNLRLNHSHFPIGDDEILMEMNDPSTRTLRINVIPRDHRSDSAFEVEWRVEKVDGRPKITAVQYCCGDQV